MESFSEQLRAEAEPIWSEIFARPFLREIKDGTLPLEKFRYYLAQDYLYPGRVCPDGLNGAGQGPQLADAGGVGPPGNDAGGAAAASQAGRRGGPVHGRHPARQACADQRGLRQPHADHRIVVGAGTHRGGAAALSLVVPRVEGRIGPVGAPIVRPVDQLLRVRDAPEQRGRLEELRGPSRAGGGGAGTGGHAGGVHDQQPIRAHVLGHGLQHGAVAGVARSQ